jgi:hypothetical protein
MFSPESERGWRWWSFPATVCRIVVTSHPAKCIFVDVSQTEGLTFGKITATQFVRSIRIAFWSFRIPFRLMRISFCSFRSIDGFQQTPSVEFNGNFTLLGVWKMEFQCKYAANRYSQMNLSIIRKSWLFSWPETQSVPFNEQNEPKCAQKYSSGQILSRKEKLRRNQVAIYYSNN